MTALILPAMLSHQTTKEELLNLFGQFGNVEDAFIPLDRETGEFAVSRAHIALSHRATLTTHYITGRPRGFGFVTLDAAAASEAIEKLNETGESIER